MTNRTFLLTKIFSVEDNIIGWSEWLVRELTRGLRFYLWLVFLPSFSLAMIVRVLDAYMQGNIWLAFSQRFNVGWPVAQILALIVLASIIYLCFSARTSTREKKINGSVKRR